MSTGSARVLEVMLGTAATGLTDAFGAKVVFGFWIGKNPFLETGIGTNLATVIIPEVGTDDEDVSTAFNAEFLGFSCDAEKWDKFS